MLNINFEFRKGIFFIRFLGDMKKENYLDKARELQELLLDNKFKYIVINTNHLKKIDLDSLNYIIEMSKITKAIKSTLVICDKTNIIKKLTHGSIPNIQDELEVL